MDGGTGDGGSVSVYKQSLGCGGGNRRARHVLDITNEIIYIFHVVSFVCLVFVLRAAKGTL